MPLLANYASTFEPLICAKTSHFIGKKAQVKTTGV